MRDYTVKPSEQWQQVVPVLGATVSARSGHCAVPTRQRRGFYVYGGAPISAGDFDVHVFDADYYQWTSYSPASGPPARKWHSCMVLADDTLVVSFGHDGVSPRSDVWAFRGMCLF